MRSGQRVALLGQHFGWGGGVDFLRHVADGLVAGRRRHGFSVHVLLPIQSRIKSCVDLLRIGKRSLVGSIARRRPWVARPQPAFDASRAAAFAAAGDAGLEVVHHDATPNGLLRCLRRIGATVALPTMATLGRNFPVPWVGYIYDFQHRHLPENFGADDCYKREISFAGILKDAPAVLVNSRAVKDDIARFYPWTSPERVVSLPFAPHAGAGWLEASSRPIRDTYSLPARYFLVSNQFWIHKDHMTAIRALELLGPESDCGLVCTGATDDYRRPGHFDEIMRSVEYRGLTGRIRMLGHIPKRDQIEVMKGALAVVQPTLFEGGPGGGCVYDAVALGVPVLLSDIPVNREATGDWIRFFPPGDAAALALLMADVSQKAPARPAAAALEARAATNLARLGDALLEAIDRALAASNRPG